MELMLAVTILAIGLLALVSVQAYAAKARNVDQNHLLAAQRADSELARIEEAAKSNFSQDFTQAETAIDHRMRFTVEQEPLWNGSPTLKGVTVTVYYPSHGDEKGGRVRAWTLLKAPQS